MPLSPASIFRQNNPYESLISQIVAYESIPQQRLEDRLDDQKDLKEVISTADSKLSALDTALTPFSADASSSPFDALTAVTGDTEAFTASASDTASVGSHTLEVQQLAKTDTRISQQYSSDGSDLRTWFDDNADTISGDTSQTFDIELAAPTDADPSHRETISVTVDPAGTTNEEILDEVKSAVDSAMNAAVDAGTIDADEKAQVSVVNDSTGTARLSIRSGDSGYTNRLAFTDSADGLLAQLEITGTHANYDGGGGGQVYDVGTGETDSELNSRFVLDGITMYRDSNTVTDALDGITLNLHEAGGPESSFSVEADSESIVSEVKDFITKFNDVQDFISSKTNVDEETSTRAPLADDYTIRNLQYELRDDVTRKVSGQPADGPSYLSDIGISLSSEGKLSLEDEDALLQAIENDAEDVKTLFNGADGVATRMKNRLGSYLGVDGLIDARKDGVDGKIDRLNDRIDDWDDRLAHREERLREQFAQVQETIAQFQGQQRFLAGFGGGAAGLGGSFF